MKCGFRRKTLRYEVLLFVAVILNFALWLNLNKVQAKWGNVPPAPSIDFSASTGLGDTSFSYRIIGLMLQNLGDSGGRVTALKDYRYEDLVPWFYIGQHLDSRSHYMPYLAAYYFSASQNPEQIRYLISYLEVVGMSEQEEKWRFLAQAIYLARFVINDVDLSLKLAEKLAAHPKKDLPNWVRQMPAFVLNQKGDKKEAYGFLLEILRSSAKSLHPNEITNMKFYICQQILSQEEAKSDPICKDVVK